LVYQSDKEIIQALHNVFAELNANDRIASKGLWTPRSNPHNSYLWGKLKNFLYESNPHDLEALKQYICKAVHNIQQRELQQVS
jgi:hypothetical protein